MGRGKLPERIEAGGGSWAVERQLGEGAFARVYRCSGREGPVAVKVVGGSADALAQAVREAQNLQKCAHAHVGRMQAYHRARDEVVIVQELLGPSLFALMQKKQETRDFVAESVVLRMTAQMAAALACIHGHQLIHRDVKPENILMASGTLDDANTCQWKLVDFGSAQSGEQMALTEEARVLLKEDIDENTSVSYRAPEMVDFFRGHAIGPAADIWALGVTMFYVSFFEQPFADGELAILNGKFTFPASRSYNDVISAALRENPTERPKAEQLGEMCRASPASRTDGSENSGASPRVSDPQNVKRVSPMDPALAAAIQEAREQSPRSGAGAGKSPRSDRSPRRMRPPPPSRPDGSANERILGEAKRLLPHIKAMRDPDMWRMEIAPDLSSPGPADVIIKAYKTAQRPFAAGSQNPAVNLFLLYRTFSHGGEFLIEGRAAETFQMMSIFHLALQSGSFLCCALGARHSSFLEEVAEHSTDVMKLYAQFLLEKVRFHSNHRFLEGNMSLGTYSMIKHLNQLRAPGRFVSDENLLTANLIHDGLDLLEKAIALQGRMLELATSSASVAYFLIPVIKETFSLMTVQNFFTSSFPTGYVDRFNGLLEQLRAHYAQVNSIQALTSQMGSAPPVAQNVDGASIGQVGMYPPSHSPFVAAFLEQNRRAAEAAAAAAAAAAASSSAPPDFPATFDGQAAMDSGVPQFPATFDGASTATVTADAAPQFSANFEANFGAHFPEKKDTEERLSADGAAKKDDPPPPAPMSVEKASKPPSAGPVKKKKVKSKAVREERLRRVGSRRGSVRDIGAMREEQARDDPALMEGLADMNRDQLVAEIVSLRRRVGELETQMGEAVLAKMAPK